jgi:hypothetical protein
VLVVGEQRVPLEQRCHDRSDKRGVKSVTGVAVGDPVRLVVPCGGIRSAPGLDHATAALALVAPAGEAPPTPTAASDAGPGPHQVAGVLMLVAALLLGGTALARRLRGDPAAPDATTADAVAAPQPAEPPRLTLVRVPREHGP